MYRSESPPITFEDVDRELRAIENALDEAAFDQIQNKVWHVAPDKPRTGMEIYADGTNWNPGSGEGKYVYKSGGTWVFLG